MSAADGLVQAVDVERWHSERPLFVLVLLCSIAAWVLLAVSLIGLAYAVAIGLFFFVSHVAFIAHLRGSAVRLGPEQMPELFGRVQEIARTLGLRRVPEVYVMQAGGALNALATRLFSSDFIVLYSDLLDACGENTEARDMIVAHELGHLRAGHLRGVWLLLPGLVVPFLGSAYSRAREYTADRYGFTACRDRGAALVGMSILAAGGKHGPRVNLRSLAAQAGDLNTAWMTLGRWLASHPPLAYRVAAVEPALVTSPVSRTRGALGAVALLACATAVPAAAALAAALYFQSAMEVAEEAPPPPEPAAPAEEAPTPALTPEEVARASAQARADMARLAAVVDEYRGRVGALPEDTSAAYAAWQLLRPGEEAPIDPFDGAPYGYQPLGESYMLWSAGPSPDTTEDDLIFEPEAQR